MLVTYPAACKPHAQNWTLSQPVQRSRSAWTGREQRLVMTGSRWAVSCEVIAMRLATYQAWASFMAQLEGSANTFQVPATTATQSGPASATWAMNGTGVVTNYLLYSEQLDNAAWTALSGGTVTANTDVAPDGTTTVDTVNCAVVNRGMRQITTLAASVGATYTFSIWLFGTAGETAKISIRNSTGTVSSQTLAITLTAAAARYSVTVTMGAGATGFIDVWVYRDAGQTAATIKAWGGQVEEGAAASTYVRTTSATAASLAAFKVTGLTVSSTNMTAGQMLTIDGRLHILTADVVADIGGKAVVSIKPNLAATTTAASVAYVQNPYAVVAMTEAPTVSVEPGPIYRVSFNAEEVY